MTMSVKDTHVETREHVSIPWGRSSVHAHPNGLDQSATSVCYFTTFDIPCLVLSLVDCFRSSQFTFFTFKTFLQGSREPHHRVFLLPQTSSFMSLVCLRLS